MLDILKSLSSRYAKTLWLQKKLNVVELHAQVRSKQITFTIIAKLQQTQDTTGAFKDEENNTA